MCNASMQVPHERWDLESYYSPEARGDLTMYARAASFVDGLDEFDASLFRQPTSLLACAPSNQYS